MPKTILIVEDEPEIRTVLVMALENGGDFTAITAKDGTEGLELAEKLHPDAILLDALMPGMDGYEVCRRLKANLITCRIPVIFLSAQSDHHNQAKSKKCGALASLVKPFDPLALASQIKSLIEQEGD